MQLIKNTFMKEWNKNARPVIGGCWWEVLVKLWLRCTLVPCCATGRVSRVTLSVDREGWTVCWLRVTSDLVAVSWFPCGETSALTARRVIGVCCESTLSGHTTAAWSAISESLVAGDNVGFVSLTATLPVSTSVLTDVTLSTGVMPVDLDMTDHQIQTF